MKNQKDFTLRELIIVLFFVLVILILTDIFSTISLAWLIIVIVFLLSFIFISETITVCAAVVFIGFLFFTEKGYSYRKCMNNADAGVISCADKVYAPKT